MLKNNQRKTTNKAVIKFVTIFSFVLIASACSEKKAPKKNIPAAAVSVYQIKTQDVGGYREFVARTQAYKEANLRARVEGELIERKFKEGAIVEKGQILLQIDPAAYQAALSSAQADLSSKLSGEDNAMRNLKRAKNLIKEGYISQVDFDKLTTEYSQAKSAVKAAKAALKQAQLNLNYTTITAPFTGRIGKVNYNIGNVVGPNSDALATLTLTDPIYVSFQVEENQYISYRQKNQNNKTANMLPVNLSLRLPNNSKYTEPGKLDFADTKIDQSMGTVELRALFANPNRLILPGLFVTLIMEGQEKEQMSLVPQSAVQANQQGKFVLVVNNDNKVVQRHVKLSRRINAMWVVESGLKSGEQVIVEGLQKVKAGVSVRAVIKVVDALTGTISDKNTDIKATTKD